MDAAEAEARIVASWRRNAAPWTRVVRERRIDSRRVTDAAIVDAVLARRPGRVLDLGCGEGWLARRLAAQGIEVLGVDGAPELIEAARAAGGARFEVVDYAGLAALAGAPAYDVVVSNFALFGDASVRTALQVTPRLLAPGGALVIQTLHPRAAGGEAPYLDGWRDGTWAGIDGDFDDPAPWYFRTIEGWQRLLADCGFERVALHEPRRAEDGPPASAIFVAAAAAVD